MAGKDFSSALIYHEATKHSEVSIGASAHYLNWDNKPAQFKEYKNLPSIALPRNFPLPKENSIKAITGEPQKTGVEKIDVGVLSELLFFSAGLTRAVRFGKELHYMRAASATGALYPIEIYVISGRIPGLDEGVYHFNPEQFSLAKLRDGDYRSALDDMGSPDSQSAPFTLAFTSLAWRNAWKYEARSYRHWFWDSGVIAANLLATSNSAGLATTLELGFVDSEVDTLLGLEVKKEATVALAVVQVGDRILEDESGAIQKKWTTDYASLSITRHGNGPVSTPRRGDSSSRVHPKIRSRTHLLRPSLHYYPCFCDRHPSGLPFRQRDIDRFLLHS